MFAKTFSALFTTLLLASSVFAQGQYFAGAAGTPGASPQVAPQPGGLSQSGFRPHHFAGLYPGHHIGFHHAPQRHHAGFRHDPHGHGHHAGFHHAHHGHGHGHGHHGHHAHGLKHHGGFKHHGSGYHGFKDHGFHRPGPKHQGGFRHGFKPHGGAQKHGYGQGQKSSHYLAVGPQGQMQGSSNAPGPLPTAASAQYGASQ